MVHTRPKPEEVFTPRASEVNTSMFVERPNLEKALSDALKGTLHIIIHGESGCGKSWLYKHLFQRENVETVIANMANASRFGSFDAELKNLVDRDQEPQKVAFQETKDAGVNVGIASGGLGRASQYEIPKMEPFEACLRLLRQKAGRRQACLVLDNFERILNKRAILEQVADAVILLDDARYAQYAVRMVVVGVPGDIQQYFARLKNVSTVANRLQEVPEVARLEEHQARDLIHRGFVTELRYRIEDEAGVVGHIEWITDGIPQQLHEYCLAIARRAETNEGRVNRAVVFGAERDWMKESLVSDYTAIEALMNARETRAQRRNQTIYALGQFTGHDFRHSDIEQIVRDEFPASTEGVQLNISQLLGELASADNPIIRRTPKGDAYRFVNPKYRMCIRAMLDVDTAGAIEKVDLVTL